MEVNVLYSTSADLNVNLIHKSPYPETSRIMLNNYLGMIDSLPELTHHRNRHTPPGQAVEISGAGKGCEAVHAGGWLGQSLCQLEKRVEAHWGCGQFLLGSGAHRGYVLIFRAEAGRKRPFRSQQCWLPVFPGGQEATSGQSPSSPARQEPAQNGVGGGAVFHPSR